MIFKLTGIEKLKTLTFVMKKINKAYRLLNSNFSKLLKRESNKWDPEKNWRIPSVCYTLEHKIAYLACEYYFLGKYSLRGIFHDWEKPWMYIHPETNFDSVRDVPGFFQGIYNNISLRAQCWLLRILIKHDFGGK